MENIANLRSVADREAWISETKYAELKRHTVRAGDMIFGSFVDDMCRVCLLPMLPTPAIAKADCFCLRPKDDVVDLGFLVYQLGSLSTRNALVEEIHGATRPRINTSQLRNLTITLQAILQKAFAGELVPTEAEVAAAEGRSFESAEDLLYQATASTPQQPTETTAPRAEQRGRSRRTIGKPA